MTTQLLSAADSGHVDREVVTRSVEMACHAPSVHNSQPWKWRLRDDRLDLYPDATRLLRTDPYGRQLIMSCGAVLHHLTVALAVEGIETTIGRFPAGAPGSSIATVGMTWGARPDARTTAMARAITERHTDRRPFRRAPLGDLLPSSSAASAALGVSVYRLGDDARMLVSGAARVSAAIHRYDSVYQNEIHWWAGHDRPYEGIPPSLLPDGVTARGVIGRDFPLGTLQAGGATLDESTWLMLCTAVDSPELWLRTGELMSEVLLAATAAGLASCTVTHVIQDPDSRKLLRKAIPAELGRRFLHPQVLIRLGAHQVPGLPATSSRRPVDEVLELGDDDD
ncbi:hypothetical protein [Williamsia sp. CHRR-6]|uniref:Acg family FMN-binding oxidoreductase n=1 Tax=Williamsia sp. CHRR-6 TaxID=2835871 RepID=UPI001BDAE345|nr:hypothetical protein [Williamsia sp. CHRR-6]MBT0567181.1 hypothetical protein [Williamsia sp. CHRR-6]